MRRIAALLSLGALAGCSSSTSAPPECAGVPESLAISEGGRIAFPATAGVTYTGNGGVVASLEGDVVAVRAPYLASASAQSPSLTASCGRTIPVALRPLAWTRLAAWTE